MTVASSRNPEPPAGLGSLYFEDFAVGQVFRSPTREVSQADLDGFLQVSQDRNPIHLPAGAESRPVLHGPFGLGVFLGLLHEMGLVEETAIAMLDANWKFHAPVHVGDALRFEMTITRCHRTSKGNRGVINRHVRLRNQEGLLVQEGTTALLMRCRDQFDGADVASRDFGSLEWARQLRALLLENQRFVSATSLYDGCIGLQSGAAACQIRIYRGTVLDIVARTPNGPSFSVVGDEIAWVELVQAEQNDFMVRAMRDEFHVTGNQYEYLRLTKAVVELFHCVRALAGSPGHP